MRALSALRLNNAMKYIYPVTPVECAYSITIPMYPVGEPIKPVEPPSTLYIPNIPEGRRFASQRPGSALRAYKTYHRIQARQAKQAARLKVEQSKQASEGSPPSTE
jgi:hypothetical protein